MNQFQLVEITTKDKLIHQGIYFEPKTKGKRAFLWVHGLSSTFYGHIALLEAFTTACEKVGYSFAAFNNRGHDLVSGIRKLDKRKPSGYTHVNGGAGYEDFKTSTFDIEAGIEFLVTRGFSEIILVGHSTGANKVCYFAGKKSYSALAGVVLASPLSDRLTPEFDLTHTRQNLKHMEELIVKGRANELQLGYHFFPLTPNRFISLVTPHSLEDQFDYGDKKPRLTHFRRVKKPLLVILGEADEYLDRPAQEIMAVYNAFEQSQKYTGLILPDTLHSYNGKETEVVQSIINWAMTI